MLINQVKTKALVVSRSRRNAQSILNILLNCTLVEVSDLKILGNVFDSKLTSECTSRIMAASESNKLSIVRKALS